MLRISLMGGRDGMKEAAQNPVRIDRPRARDWFARALGVSDQRKMGIYDELSDATSLRDLSYWLQIIFAAGIATLGLVLNSPAVIIGAMLISPLMGPILALGLAFVSGDLVLGARASVNLALSCTAAVIFATILVGFLPFKETTNEIASRTSPTLLDLTVALLSGGIGSIASSKETKGVVWSIPGVAIAVALMPPLSVVGWGLGVAFSLDASEGIRVAKGGGLLFLTNLVGIVLAAAVVFLALHVDTQAVRELVAHRRKTDTEGRPMQPGSPGMPAALRKIGSLPARLMIMAIALIIILVPLTESFRELKYEVAARNKENGLKRAAAKLWRASFGKLPDGQPRSYIGDISTSRQDGKSVLLLRIFTTKPITAEERLNYESTLESSLHETPETLGLQLVQIPTVASELARGAAEAKPSPPPTIREMKESLAEAAQSPLQGIRFPSPAVFVDCDVVASQSAPLKIIINYLSDRDITADAEQLIAGDVRSRLEDPTAETDLHRIPVSPAELAFQPNQTAIAGEAPAALDRVGAALQKHPSLQLEVQTGSLTGEGSDVAQRRIQAITEYLTSEAHVDPGRITGSVSAGAGDCATLNFSVAGSYKPSTP